MHPKNNQYEMLMYCVASSWVPSHVGGENWRWCAAIMIPKSTVAVIMKSSPSTVRDWMVIISVFEMLFIQFCFNTIWDLSIPISFRFARERYVSSLHLLYLQTRLSPLLISSLPWLCVRLGYAARDGFCIQNNTFKIWFVPWTMKPQLLFFDHDRRWKEFLSIFPAS